MDRDDELFVRRLKDLARSSQLQDRCVYTDFLDLHQQNIYYSHRKDLAAVQVLMYGGYLYAERQMLAFLPDAFYFSEESSEDLYPSFPIEVLRIYPANVRFAQKLSHRDYLGALLNLGIDRAKTGDIAVMEHEALVFVCEGIADFIADNLKTVSRTSVLVEKAEASSLNYRPELKSVHASVATVRIDSLIAAAFGESRSSLRGLVEEGKVFINGQLVLGNGVHIQEGDKISVRGMGRFIYDGVTGKSKKGRTLVALRVFV